MPPGQLFLACWRPRRPDAAQEYRHDAAALRRLRRVLRGHVFGRVVKGTSRSLPLRWAPVTGSVTQRLHRSCRRDVAGASGDVMRSFRFDGMNRRQLVNIPNCQAIEETGRRCFCSGMAKLRLSGCFNNTPPVPHANRETGRSATINIRAPKTGITETVRERRGRAVGARCYTGPQRTVSGQSFQLTRPCPVHPPSVPS